MTPGQNRTETNLFGPEGATSVTETQPTSRDDAYLSKLVILRGERHDGIVITNVVRRFASKVRVPDHATIVHRSNPYYGPKITLVANERNYLLTAPGPDTQLLLWSSELDDNGQRKGWEKLAEVTARLADDLPSYEFCPQCDEPLKTLKHEKQAELGCCPDAD